MKSEPSLSGAIYTSIKALVNGALIDVYNFDSCVYTYKTEGPDQFTFTIKDSDISIVDSPQFQEKIELRVMWGFAGGPFSPTRKVYIDNLKYKYGSYGVEISVSALDKGSNLAINKSRTTYKNKTISEVTQDIAYTNGLKYTPVPFTEDDYKMPLGSDLWGEKGMGFQAQEIESTIPDNMKKRANISLFETKINYSQTTSDLFTLNYLMARADGGPFVVETRDDTIRIGVKAMGSKPVKSFTWKGGTGELISFDPESKNESKATEVVSGGWDEENKEYLEGSATELTDDNDRLSDFVNLKGSIKSSEATRDLKKYQEFQLSAGTARASTSEEDGVFSKKTNTKITNATPGYKKENQDGSTNYIPYRTDVKLFDPILDGYSEKTFDPKLDPFSNKLEKRTQFVSMFGSEKPIDENNPSSVAANELTNATLESNPGSCEIVGEPSLESNQVITIIGVSKKHSGNYLITECEHNLGTTYTVSCKLRRNATGSVSTTNPNKVDVKTIKKPINNGVGAKFIDETKEVKEVSSDFQFDPTFDYNK